MADGKITDQTDGVQIASGDQVLVDRAGADRRVPLATMGTWTPSVTFGGGSTGITYSSRTAQWTRIGDRIFFNISIVMTDKGSSTGAAQVTGLPVAADATSGNVQTFSIRMLEISSASAGLLCRVLPGGTDIDLQFYTGSPQNPSNLTNTNFGTTVNIQISGQYKV